MSIQLVGDPNWFYSTLAQSTAALVGLAGAFLLQMLFAQRAEVGPRRLDLRVACLDLMRGIEADVVQAEAVLETLEPALRTIEMQKEAGDPIDYPARNVLTLSPEGGASGQLGLPAPEGFDGIEMLRRAVEDVRKFKGTLEAISWEILSESLRSGEGLGVASPWPDIKRPAAQTASPQTIWARIEGQRFDLAYRFGLLQSRAEDLSRQLTDLRAMLVPRSLWFLFAILGGLLLCSVVVPMTYLAAEGGASKPLLLCIFTPLATAFVGYFGYELWKLRRADRLKDEIF